MEFADYLAISGRLDRFIALSVRPGRTFEAEAEQLLELCREAMTGMHPVYLRFHLSDISNQAEILRRMLAHVLPGAAVSLTGQPPVDGSRIAVEGWLSSRALSQLKFLPGNDPGEGDAYFQTAKLFEDLAAALPQECSVADNVLRTWIYCRDIDNNYFGVVKARREFFDTIGLTAKTHYIASTGIGGGSTRPGQLVMMDSLLFFGDAAAQLRYLHAPEFLSPTHIYGVTFERGTRLVSRDESYCFLSGTASIDKNGEIVHPQDAVRQTGRALDNIEALLAEGKASSGDLKLAVVYLRDPADRRIVERVISKRLGGATPYLIVHAPVCRPGWLVEVEGIAVNGSGEKALPALI